MVKVLNLVISGIPSIPLARFTLALEPRCFKPCYKWNTFNTSANSFLTSINSPGFKPCYKWNTFNTLSGAPIETERPSFKPCYKWNTFNTRR